MTPDSSAPAAAPKSIWASKTIWAALLVALIPLLQACGVKLFETADADQIAGAISAVVGVVLTILARRNMTPVTVVAPPANIPLVALLCLGAALAPLSGCNLTPTQQETLATVGWGLVRTAVTVGLAVAGKESPGLAPVLPHLQAAVDQAASDPKASAASIAAALTAAAETNIADPALRKAAVDAVKRELVAAADTPAAGKDAAQAVRARAVAAAL